MEIKHAHSKIVTIVEYDSTAAFVIDGQEYHGLKDLIALKMGTSKSTLGNYLFDIFQNKYGKYLLYRSEGFPCFDSSDYAHENRSYHQFMICNSMEEALKKYDFIQETSESFNIIAFNSPKLAPLVYATDGIDKIQIMTKNK